MGKSFSESLGKGSTSAANGCQQLAPAVVGGISQLGEVLFMIRTVAHILSLFYFVSSALFYKSRYSSSYSTAYSRSYFTAYSCFYFSAYSYLYSINYSVLILLRILLVIILLFLTPILQNTLTTKVPYPTAVRCSEKRASLGKMPDVAFPIDRHVRWDDIKKAVKHQSHVRESDDCSQRSNQMANIHELIQ